MLPQRTADKHIHGIKAVGSTPHNGTVLYLTILSDAVNDSSLAHPPEGYPYTSTRVSVPLRAMCRIFRIMDRCEAFPPAASPVIGCTLSLRGCFSMQSLTVPILSTAHRQFYTLASEDVIATIRLDVCLLRTIK
jgi:hypothetical protein